MKLYYHPISPNCRRVLATVFENKRDDVELVVVDLMKGEHRQPAYLAINPNGKVPTLVDGDLKLWESTPIMQYLSGDSPLWPPSKVRYDITRWQVWAVVHWGPALGKIVNERMVKPMLGRGAPDEAIVAKGLEELDQFGGVLDGHLDGRDWLVGDGLTLADYAVAANLTFNEPAGIDISKFANVVRWYDRIQAREAWQKSAPPSLG